MENTKLHKALWFAGPVLSNLKVYLQCKEDFLSMCQNEKQVSL